MVKKIAKKKTVVKAVKKVTKKAPLKVATASPESSEKVFNDYGVCIACQGGIEECLHNNLADTNGHIVCVTCGKVVQ